jgi:hypothetical protein
LPVHHPRQALVDKDTVAVAKQLFAMLFNAHRRLFPVAHHELVNFTHRLIEYAGGPVHRFVIHKNQQVAQKLVKFELNYVFLRLSNLNGKSHNKYASVNDFRDANLMPYRRTFCAKNAFLYPLVTMTLFSGQKVKKNGTTTRQAVQRSQPPGCLKAVGLCPVNWQVR